MIKLQQAFAFAVFAMVGAAPPAAADPVADFYSGKTVQLVIGYAPGGGYDIYARTLARHMARHIPGNPAIVVQNMPGAGSIKAANYLYNIAPKDGTAFGGFSRGAFLDPLLGRTDGVQFVASKYGWLGSISNEVGVCAFRADSGVASWKDMQARPYIIGSTGAGADSDVFPTVLRQISSADKSPLIVLAALIKPLRRNSFLHFRPALGPAFPCRVSLTGLLCDISVVSHGRVNSMQHGRDRFLSVLKTGGPRKRGALQWHRGNGTTRSRRACEPNFDARTGPPSGRDSLRPSRPKGGRP
jgi:hypothetical protein